MAVLNFSDDFDKEAEKHQPNYVLLQPPNPMSAEDRERLRKAWEKIHSGPAKITLLPDYPTATPMVLNVKPDSVVIIKWKGCMGQEAAERFLKEFKEAAGIKNRCVLLEDGMDIVVLDKADG